MTGKILVTANEAAQMLSVSTKVIYDLAAAGDLEKRYIGAGTRNFRIPVASLQAYADNLPIDPVSEAS